MYQFGFAPTTNKPARITKDTISAIGQIIANSIIYNEFKTAILTADISDHFPIIYAFKRDDSRKYMPAILLLSSAKRIATQIVVTAKLNGRKNFVLRGFVCDIIRPSKELPGQS